jgi:TolB-like protein/class 3 adenylate cyclase/Flp pilus assembly protein TadD
MVEERVDRRLAAIFAGDVAGYSRLMGVDEEGTLRQLKVHRKELVDPKITEHRGRIVKTTGDGVLVEFVSVVDAVRCAVDIQRGMLERNSDVPTEKLIQFRIGINVGDIIIDGDDIYGDGVNVAARLETLAEPGGIMVSRVVHDQVQDKLGFEFDDMGEQAVKNIARPVGIHRVHLTEQAPRSTAPAAGKTEWAASERPSIAVLPFVNMSGDPEQEYFGDGISEDIITGLSKLRWFFVIARNSSFIYKGKAIDVKRAARELGVRYVLEGSVRKGGNRVRITAQLIDAATGNHIWADRYDGDLSDIFALQDEITHKVVAAIEPKLLEAEAVRSQNRSPEDLGAWDMVMHANSLFWRLNKPDGEAAVAMLRRAVTQYPDYGPAHSMLAFILLISGRLAWTSAELEAQVPEAQKLAAKAMSLDNSDPWAHLALGFVAYTKRSTDEAVEEFTRALDLNPNFAAAHGYLALALALADRSKEAITHGEQAIRMSPHDPQTGLFNVALAAAHYLQGRFNEAVVFGRKAVQLSPQLSGAYRIYVASLAQAGQIDEAHEALQRLKELQPAISIAWIERYVPYTASAMTKFIDGMRKAGLE